MRTYEYKEEEEREGCWKIGHKIRTYYMDGPKQMLWNIFCVLFRPSTLGHHLQQDKKNYRKTRNFHQKLNALVAWQIAGFNDLMIKWFLDSWIRTRNSWIRTVTRGFELVTRGFELVTHGFELLTRWFELIPRAFEFQLVLSSFQIVTRNS